MNTRIKLEQISLINAGLSTPPAPTGVLGVFHSHPDHPNHPSEFDREWAVPWFSYIITSVMQGKAAGSRSWVLEEDRSRFLEEEIR